MGSFTYNTAMSPTPLQPIHHPLLDKKQVTLWIKREDLNHPTISGNKWHKLKLNLQAAQTQGYDTLLSFGGPYSNHIYALATAAQIYNLKSIGLIRGELHNNPTLNDAKRHGMQLYPLSRQDYRKKDEPHFLAQLTEQFGPHYLIPEGGSNALAVTGCMSIIHELATQINLEQTIISCACGTGGTLAGLIAGSATINCQLIGFPVLKQGEFLYSEIKQLLIQSGNYSSSQTQQWQLVTDYHLGGYGKVPAQLIQFIQDFEYYNPTILLDPVYTAKLCYGLFDLIRQDRFNQQTLIMIHTGGLQGRRGIPELVPIST
ncbi:D-cysteine desulfhydrase [Piscirickettsia salmonis]|uniref:D-cysteine desulfhydrase n=2 Tax=Piscirickettsia salmonis TaxID=1238 RepID=A0A9Q6PUK2_PISSA|nr:pyridoxal-phosphate dependent enzyme [Piscirickettsia salmonis]ALA25707.1 pyridoxal-phosphate dependent enzyme family protein [Piscirickettsia salmonis]QGN78145.1 D-cysteine desulfhydrase [Piscirickettsia salmonis]QGN81725.1 D-cysteine desulfhydrase [Piscirickettsia salmonis]QGN84002.1 D-cysteine desulfhydrase [Piscirickettsia salmonis]QGN87513.1 D-cysteine desulfhydrase [Piscirickettsia salmonis]